MNTRKNTPLPLPRTPEPVPFAEALGALRRTGLLAAGDGKPGPTGTDDDEPAGLAHWPDGPGRVLERTDALDLSEVTWDDATVLAAVREIADLAHLPYSRIRVVDEPAEFPLDPDAAEDLRHDECSGSPLRLGWVRQLGFLADRRPAHRLRDWISANRQPTDAETGSPGHALREYRVAELWLEGDELTETIVQSSVSELVETYAGFMLTNGAAGWEHDWQPRDGLLDEFGTELRIGSLFTDAFCAGLGYFAVVDDEITLARRPVLRVLADPGIDGRPRFHHDSGPAVEFSDGSGPRFLEGVHFPSWLHRAIVDGALAMRYVRDMAWPEARMAAYPSMPPAASLDGLDASLLDVGSKGTYLYRVDDLPDHDGPAWYMVMTDPSTGRDYGEFVPPEIGVAGSADAAQAAAWGISVDDYLRMTLEG